jgi:hypothetical protein
VSPGRDGPGAPVTGRGAGLSFALWFGSVAVATTHPISANPTEGAER